MNRYIAVLLTSIVAAFSPVSIAAAASSKNYTATTNMKFGAVRVTVTIKGKKIVNVTSVLPTEKPKSTAINKKAGPILRREALRAQSAKINVVSGATYTSNAYASSLQAALDKANL
jgi:uncharacterized protein with FMN-binding domain